MDRAFPWRWWPRRLPADGTSPRGTAVDLALGLLTLLGAICLSVLPEPGTVRVEMESATPGALQLFFDQGTGFSEALSSTVPYAAGRHTLAFAVPDGDSVRIRLDPSPGTTELVLHGISSEVAGAASAVPLGSLAAASEVSSIVADGSTRTVRMADGASDPQVLVPLDRPISASGQLRTVDSLLWQALFAFAILLVVRRIDLPRLPAGQFVVAGITLVLAMAVLSPLTPSPHPDEFLHVADARYFDGNWLPPSLRDDALAASYTSNVYGVSYLYEWNIVYWFAGKAGSIARLGGIDPLLAYRLFNVGLMALVALAIGWARLPKSALAVLFVTPQLWYVFAYFNGDAFPFAMGCIAVALVAARDGPVQTFIRAGGRVPAQAVVLAVALALLLVSKKNFLPVAVFASLWLCASCLHLRASAAASAAAAFAVCVFLAAAGPDLNAEFGLRWWVPALACLIAGAVMGVRWLHAEWTSDPSRRAGLLRFAFLHLVVVALALPWIGADLLQNGAGSDKAQLVTDMRERHAAYPFKPSTITRAPAQSQPGLQLAVKDIALVDTMQPPYDWARGSFRSFFSAYGYLKFFGPAWLYIALGISLAVLVAAGSSAGIRSGAFGMRHLALVAGCAGSVVVAAALHSWTYDFQPQGRYVFPLLPMLLPLFAAEPRSRPWRTLFRAALAAALALSVYSFLRVGLANLA